MHVWTCPNVLEYTSLPDSTPQWHAATIPGIKLLHHVYQHTCSCFITMHYDVQFTVRMVLLIGNIDSTIWLPYLHDLFLLILVHSRTIFHYVTVPLFHTFWSLVQHTLYHVTLLIIMLAVQSTLFSLFCIIWWHMVYIFMHKTPSTLFVQ